MESFLLIIFCIPLMVGIFLFGKGFFTSTLLMARLRFKKLIHLGEELSYSEKEKRLIKKALKDLVIGVVLIALSTGTLNLITYGKFGWY